jgi:hypothetical protein
VDNADRSYDVHAKRTAPLLPNAARASAQNRWRRIHGAFEPSGDRLEVKA